MNITIRVDIIPCLCKNRSDLIEGLPSFTPQNNDHNNNEEEDFFLRVTFALSEKFYLYSLVYHLELKVFAYRYPFLGVS